MSTQDTLGNTKQRPKPQRQTVASSTPSPEGLVDLEFSDYARDPRVLSGWWIAPAVILGAAFMFWAAYLIF